MKPAPLAYTKRSSSTLQRFGIAIILIGSLYMIPTIIDFISSNMVSVASIPRLGPFGIGWNLYASFGAVLCSCGVLSISMNLIYPGKRTLMHVG